MIGQISGFDIRLAARGTLGTLMIEITLDNVPRSGFSMSRESFLEGGSGLIQRIENRVSGIPSLLEQARSDLVEAQQAAADAETRLGKPFKHATALAEAEEDLARVETQLAAMQDDASPAPEPVTSGRAALTVDAVKAHQPSMGIRPDPDRAPAPMNAAPAARSEGRETGRSFGG